MPKTTDQSRFCQYLSKHNPNPNIHNTVVCVLQKLVCMPRTYEAFQIKTCLDKISEFDCLV